MLKSKEDYFIELLKVLKPKTLNEYPDSIFYIYKDKFYIEYNKRIKYAWLNYNRIWSIFESKYHCSCREIKEITGHLLEEHLKLRRPTTGSEVIMVIDMLEKHLKLNGVTTINN